MYLATNWNICTVQRDSFCLVNKHFGNTLHRTFWWNGNLIDINHDTMWSKLPLKQIISKCTLTGIVGSKILSRNNHRYNLTIKRRQNSQFKLFKCRIVEYLPHTTIWSLKFLHIVMASCLRCLVNCPYLVMQFLRPYWVSL